MPDPMPDSNAHPPGSITPNTEYPNRSLTLDGEVYEDEPSILFIGTATLLIEYGGFRILTDPNFIHRHEEVPLGYGLHATRLTDPAIEIEDLPPIDFVLLSHFHGDHFDHVAEERLDPNLPIVTTPEAAEALRERGFLRVDALEPWERMTVMKPGATVTLTAAPGKHGPAVVDFALPEVMGTVLDFGAPDGPARPDLRLYITGDTLVIEELDELPRRYPEIDVAMLHLGGTRVMGITVTMDAEQGVEMIRRTQPRLAVPIHYDDYDVFKSPLEDFRTAVREAGLEERVHYLERGERLSLASMASHVGRT